MLNLLPQAAKEQLKFLKTRKIIFIFGFLLVIFLGLFYSLLQGLNHYLVLKGEEQKTLVEERQRELDRTDLEQLKSQTTAINQQLSDIQQFQKREVRFSPILTKFSRLGPEDLYFKKLALKREEPAEKSEEALGTLTFSGFASTRQNLFFFKKDLESQEEFSEVWFSPASWLKPTDIDFSASLQFKF